MLKWDMMLNAILRDARSIVWTLHPLVRLFPEAVDGAERV